MTKPKVEIYTAMFCGYCILAKRLLKKKGVAFEVIDVTFKPAERRRMEKRANGRHTLPQVFINGRSVGGCDDLYALDKAGKLDPLLGPHDGG